MGVNSLPKTVTRQRRYCDFNPGPSAPKSSTLSTRATRSRDVLSLIYYVLNADSGRYADTLASYWHCKYLVVQESFVSVFEHAAYERACNECIQSRRAVFHCRRLVTALYLQYQYEYQYQYWY